MNPCPCGYHGDPKGRCNCTPQQITRYRNKISGPLLDRIDLHVPVNAIPIEELQDKPKGEASQTVRTRVAGARETQVSRQSRPNAQLQGKQLHAHCELGTAHKQLLSAAMSRLNLSARAYDRILRVARTIADLAGEPNIEVVHISEALGYRTLDRAVG